MTKDLPEGKETKFMWEILDVEKNTAHSDALDLFFPVLQIRRVFFLLHQDRAREKKRMGGG